MQQTFSKQIKIYIDGACSGNPGKGGVGIILMYNQYQKELSFGFKQTTNNRMELMALIIALEQLKEKNLYIDVYSDSKYLIDAIQKQWLQKWISTKFNDGKIKNQDLWLKIHQQLQSHQINFYWVKGHHLNQYNNRCDELAVQAIQQKELSIDDGYLQNEIIKEQLI